jgi:hypothetical protein
VRSLYGAPSPLAADRRSAAFRPGHLAALGLAPHPHTPLAALDALELPAQRKAPGLLAREVVEGRLAVVRGSGHERRFLGLVCALPG